MAVYPPWGNPPIDDGDPPPETVPALVWTIVPGLTVPPATGSPVPYPAEVIGDPDFPDRTVFAFDDTRPEGVTSAISIPSRSSGWVFRIGWRARTAPPSDSAVVFAAAYRCPYSPTTWTVARLGAGQVATGVSTWIESVFTLSPGSFPVPPATHGVLVIWRDPTDPADDLTGDALVAAIGVEVFP